MQIPDLEPYRQAGRELGRLVAREQLRSDVITACAIAATLALVVLVVVVERHLHRKSMRSRDPEEAQHRIRRRTLAELQTPVDRTD